jgi:maleylpyruvate isomerase
MYFDDLSLEERLQLARRGTAYFAQCVADLPDARLDDPTFLPTWSRRHVLAHVGYNAAALSRLLDWASTGVETPMYPSAEYRDNEIAQGATLPADELRKLVEQMAFKLDEKWRNLPQPAWEAEVRTAQGRLVSAAETVWMRCREVWIHAVDFDNGAKFDEFPSAVLESLLIEIVSAWHRKGVGADLVLAVDDRAPITLGQQSCGTTISGSLAAVVQWATGRGTREVHTSNPDATSPRWL